MLYHIVCDEHFRHLNSNYIDRLDKLLKAEQILLQLSDNRGNIPLHYLFQKYVIEGSLTKDGFKNLVDLLIRYYPESMQKRNCDGENPLQYALKLSHVNVARSEIVTNYCFLRQKSFMPMVYAY